MSARRRQVTVVATLSLRKGVSLAEAKAAVRDRVNAECGDPGRKAIQIRRLTRYDPPAEIERLRGLLKDIGDFAHDRSTGPTVPDDLWEIRRMAYDL